MSIISLNNHLTFLLSISLHTNTQQKCQLLGKHHDRRQIITLENDEIVIKLIKYIKDEIRLTVFNLHWYPMAFEHIYNCCYFSFTCKNTRENSLSATRKNKTRLRCTKAERLLKRVVNETEELPAWITELGIYII